MYDFLDKIGLKAVLEVIKGKMPTSLPANGGNADTAKQVECVDIIGTVDSCTYKTILDWANHYKYQGCSAWAFVQSAYGVPSDAPEQIEGVVRIESDDTGARRLVTWTSYHTNGCSIFTRPIFNNVWNGDWHTVNADTLDGYHAADFANAYNDYLGTYLAGKSGDIRELAYLLPTGGLLANTLYPEFENITFPTFGDILITWNKSKHSQNGYIYGVLTIRPMTSTGDTYICSVYNNTSYTDWQKIADGGNADTLDGLHADDFYSANNKPYVTGSTTTATKTVTTNHGFTPSAVFYWVPSQGRWLCGSDTFDTTSFQLSFSPSESIVVNYLIFR